MLNDNRYKELMDEQFVDKENTKPKKRRRNSLTSIMDEENKIKINTISISDPEENEKDSYVDDIINIRKRKNERKELRNEKPKKYPKKKSKKKEIERSISTPLDDTFFLNGMHNIDKENIKLFLQLQFYTHSDNGLRLTKNERKSFFQTSTFERISSEVIPESVGSINLLELLKYYHIALETNRKETISELISMGYNPKRKVKEDLCLWTTNDVVTWLGEIKLVYRDSYSYRVENKKSLEKLWKK
eukprot:UN25525